MPTCWVIELSGVHTGSRKHLESLQTFINSGSPSGEAGEANTDCPIKLVYLLRDIQFIHRKEMKPFLPEAAAAVSKLLHETRLNTSTGGVPVAQVCWDSVSVMSLKLFYLGAEN